MPDRAKRVEQAVGLLLAKRPRDALSQLATLVDSSVDSSTPVERNAASHLMAEMADASLAKRLFQQNDLDQNGVLDAWELRKVVRELAAAFGVYLTNDQVNAEVAKCSANFASAGGVTEDGFQRYAASEPAAFGALFLWREVFSRYASASDELQEADAVKLVMDVCAVNKHAIAPAKANAEAVELIKTADVKCRGSINFFEFVAYAREREALFGQLTREVCTTPPPTPVPLPRPLHRALHISAALSHQVMKDVGGARKKPAAGAGVGSKAGGAATRSPRASGRQSEGRGGGGSSGGGGGAAGAVGAGAVGAAAPCADGGGGCAPTGSSAAASAADTFGRNVHADSELDVLVPALAGFAQRQLRQHAAADEMLRRASAFLLACVEEADDAVLVSRIAQFPAAFLGAVISMSRCTEDGVRPWQLFALDERNIERDIEHDSKTLARATEREREYVALCHYLVNATIKERPSCNSTAPIRLAVVVGFDMHLRTTNETDDVGASSGDVCMQGSVDLELDIRTGAPCLTTYKDNTGPMQVSSDP